MEKEFKVGEKVKVKLLGNLFADLFDGDGVGQVGTVVNIKLVERDGKKHFSYGVEFERKDNPALRKIAPNNAGCNTIKKSLSCKMIEGKTGRFGYCRNFINNQLEHYKQETEDITIKDGVITYYKDGEPYCATCQDGDDFDIEKGVMIALLKAHGVKYSQVRKLADKIEKDIDALLEPDIKIGDYVKIKKGREKFVIGATCKEGKVYKVVNVFGFLAGGSILLNNGGMVLGFNVEKVNKSK